MEDKRRVKTDFESVKKLIKRKILAKYKMTITEFANSEHVTKNLGMKPSTFKVFNSTGSNSYPAMKKIMDYLELPTLEREIEVIRSHKYFLVSK